MKKFQLMVGSMVLSFGVLFLLFGCGGGGSAPATASSPPPPTPGSVSGTVTVSSLILPVSMPVMGLSNGGSDPLANVTDFVPGEIMVRFKVGVDEKAVLVTLLRTYQDVGLVNTGPIYPGGPYLLRTNAYKNNGITQGEAKRQTKDVLLRLRTEPTIKYAELNTIAHPSMIPNDPAYAIGLQWDLNMINLPSAWELTQGSPSVIVAVLDTGIRSHPDLDANVLSTGFNFVDMTANPTEPLTPNASFHGTHVAGTIAAIGNNNVGMAGVAWNVKIMPIRVLGSFGGSITSIINGMLYAAGLPNSSGKIPLQRANVINMSLGGQGACSQVYQDAVTQVINAGVVIVAAAGNSFASGNPIITPASCLGVIAVGAVDPTGNKASYSESQPYVFIAAPGGEEVQGIHAGVLSTLPVSASGQPSYKFEQGTSMAAPHIAGVVALMFSVKSNLTPSQVATILSQTASPIGLSVPNSDYGWGLVDAGKAVAQAKGVPIPSVPIPYPIRSLVNFGNITSPMIFTNTVLNTGGGTLTLSGVAPFVYTPTGGSWLSVTFGDDPTCAGFGASFCKVNITVDPAGLPTGEYLGFVVATSNGGNFAIPVVIRVGALPLPQIGPMTIQLFSITSTPSGVPTFGNLVATATTPVVSQNYTFTFPSVPPGNYVAVAGVDKNGDGVFGDAKGEASTISAMTPITVISGQTASGINLDVENELDDIFN